MAPILDTIHHGRHVRIVSADSTSDDDPVFSVLIDGRVFSGFHSRVDALAAARTLTRP